MSGGNHKNVFVQIAEEIGVAALIIVGHGFLAILIVAVGAFVHKALEFFAKPGHEPELAGVTARYLIDGAEIMLVGVILGMGILSALVLLLVRLINHARG